MIDMKRQIHDSLDDRSSCVHGPLSVTLVARIWTVMLAAPAPTFLPVLVSVVKFVMLFFRPSNLHTMSCPMAVEALYTYNPTINRYCIRET